MGCVMEWNDCEWLLRRNVFDCYWLNWWTCLMIIGMESDKLVNVLVIDCWNEMDVWLSIVIKWLLLWLKRLKRLWWGMEGLKRSCWVS